VACHAILARSAIQVADFLLYWQHFIDQNAAHLQEYRHIRPDKREINVAIRENRGPHTRDAKLALGAQHHPFAMDAVAFDGNPPA